MPEECITEFMPYYFLQYKVLLRYSNLIYKKLLNRSTYVILKLEVLQ